MKERIDKKGNVNYDEKSLLQFIRIPSETGLQLLAKIGTKPHVTNADTGEVASSAE
jgi:hypothetical protein